MNDGSGGSTSENQTGGRRCVRVRGGRGRSWASRPGIPRGGRGHSHGRGSGSCGQPAANKD